MRARSSSPVRFDELHARAADAASLAASLPLIAMEARRLSASISLGLHGRGRAGPGESFWQYRALRTGEAQSRIDWRKSARHADTLYVRDHEWEAARAFHIFIDRSQSMHYGSGKHPQKIDHALIMGLTLADLLVRSGERVGLIGQTTPSASRQIIDRLAEALHHEWEAARAFHIFIDRSQSMHYGSGKHPQKIDHALIMGLALADLLVRSGERVGLIGQTTPSASRQIIDRLAEALLQPITRDVDLPRPLRLSKQAHLILIGDFLIEPETIEKTLTEFDRDNISITLLRMLDPTEIDFPFSGETELLSAERALALNIGDAAGFASEVRKKLQAHDQALHQIAQNRHAFFITHRTDEAMTQNLLTLMRHFSRRQDAGALRAHG